jgi:hypothetical protein
MDIHDWPYIKKSARRKKRLVKKDFDKQLLKLDKLQDSLWEKRRKLPMVPLANPYQKGWKRFFVLRDDIQRGPKAEFYQTLLNKINTCYYHHDRSFKQRKRKRKRYAYLEKPQELRAINSYDWFHNELGFTEAEKALFIPRQVWSGYTNRLMTEYVFIEPWRFVLTIKPHIIHEKKQHDEILEKEINEIESHIRYNHLWPRIDKIKNVNHRYWKVDAFEKLQYINPLKNQPRYTSTEAYLDY